MRRRRFVIAAGALLATPLPIARAQRAASVARIGFLGLDHASNPRGMDSFLQGLRELGYAEGRNVVIEYRDAQQRFERFPALAAELVALGVDVIVAPSVVASQAAKQATRSIPVIFAGVADPVADGLVASLARPGGNVTGLSSLAPELVAKRLALLKESVPRVDRVAMLWQPGSGMERTDRLALKDAESAAGALAVGIALVEARAAADIPGAFSTMVRERAHALVVLGTPMFFTERHRIANLAARTGLPAMYPTKHYVDAGGLMAYGASLDDLQRRAASYVDKVLRGAKPADLPVEQPTKFELVVSLKAAKALGLTIPRSVLGRADEVVA